MKSQERILLSLSLISLLLVIGLAPFTCSGEKLPSYGLDDHAAIGRVTRGILSSPLFGIATSPPGDVLPVSASLYPVHNLNTSENFSSIQEAIDDSNTSDSHLIEVDPGTYSENVRVNKPITIRSSSGDPRDTVVEAANASDHVFTVTTDNVTLNGFTIEGATGEGKAGVYLYSSNNRILNNILTSNYYGVISMNSVGGTQAHYTRDSRVEGDVHEYATVRDGAAYFDEVANSDGRGYKTIPVEASGSRPMIRDREPQVVSKRLLTNSLPARASSSNNNSIASNNVSFNFVGIAVIGSTGNIISNNLVKSNDDTGIYLDSSNDNVVTNNTASHTRDYSGICIWDSCSNVIVNNNASSNSNYASGIELVGSSSDNLIDNNTASSNGGAGIILWGSNDNNMITNNTALYNGYSGIDLLWFSSSNIMKSNIVNSNEGGGITLWEFNDNNTITHNTASYNKNSSGIQLAGSSSINTVKNNTASSNSRVGIGLWHSTNNNAISHNTVHDNKKGVQITDSATHNSITNNTAKFNADCGVALFKSSSNNTIAQNDLSSNSYGLTIISEGGNPSNNYVLNNTISSNNLQGIWLLDIRDPNNISSNTVTNNDIFGIGVSKSTNISIDSNTANFNEIGIGLLLSEDIQLTDNVADSNKITGFYLWESHNNTIVNNTANSNQFEGVYLINSSFNDISANTLSSSYFGVSLYYSTNNTIADNDADQNYYFELLLHSSPGNTFPNDSCYNQTDIVYGASIFVMESTTPSLQAVDTGTDATYALALENLGNMLDTYDLTVSRDDAPRVVLHLEPDTITLGPGALDYETIELRVGDTEPGIYRSTIEARSQNDTTVSDSVETWTIVRGEVDSESVTSTIDDSAIITSSINDSAINRSAIINSTISGSTITESVITSSVIVGTTLSDVTVANAIVTDGVISTGSLTINGITYEIDGEVRIADLVMGSDYSDSNLVGITDSKTLTVIAEDSDIDFDIRAKADYFAGSMRLQKSEIPPDGIPEDSKGNNVGGYVYADVSENVANSTERVLVRVYYDQTELGDIDENSLRLRYFNDSAEDWEEIPLGGVNSAEHYVWANISHYSVFSVSGSVTPKKPSKSGGGASHADSDDDGLTDLQELILGTDKDNADTDGDGFKDGEDPFPVDPHLPLRSTATPRTIPTPTPILTTAIAPTRSPPSTPTILEEGKPGFEFPIPGFEALFASGGLLAVAYLVLRRRG